MIVARPNDCESPYTTRRLPKSPGLFTFSVMLLFALILRFAISMVSDLLRLIFFVFVLFKRNICSTRKGFLESLIKKSIFVFDLAIHYVKNIATGLIKKNKLSIFL